ncbi:F-box only protein 21-like isoform X1 [Asterias rubens]|uniref:F-box only protein 21-like isoform X1 n=2 Tax=Asterias rubens TaxID=7604 RepID=UPI00145502C5|nr:F-box only protein 21-like isoform X1 [Asterias rubens]
MEEGVEKCGFNHFVFLPTEVISLILKNTELSFSDVVTFGKTCKRFVEITSDNELWKVKLFTRWPSLLKSANETDPTPTWLNLCKKLYPIPAKVNDVIMGLSAECFHQDEVSYCSFRRLKDLSASGLMHHHLVINTLMNKVFDKDEDKNLTEKYYSKKALRCVHHSNMKQEWWKYIALPIEQQSLFEGAMLFEKWYSPFRIVDCDKIRSEVTEIANQGRRKLKPEHPCYHGNIEGAVEMTPDQCYEVFDAVNEVMYKEMGFKGNKDDYYNRDNSFMSKVMTTKLGIPITLCILYQAVVQKLGVILRPVNFPGHFMLSWNYTSDGFKETPTILYIDAFRKGNVMTMAETLMQGLGQHGFNPDYCKTCAPSDVFKRMAANIMHISSQMMHHDSEMYSLYGEELHAVLKPEDFETVFQCVKVYVQRRVHFVESLEMIREIRPQTNREANGVRIMTGIIQETMQQEEARTEQTEAYRREANTGVTYSVGMVMRHVRYHYSCVIYGWDPVCKLSRQWQRQMGVDQLPNKENQAFYNVLVSDSSSRYAAQENLEYIDDPIAITHPEIGRYFEEFTKKCYLPNTELAKQYPDDAAVTTVKSSELFTD